MNANRFITAVALIGGLLSASAGAQGATYWDDIQDIRASTQSAAATGGTEPKVFESPLAHLRETHGVGLPASNRTVAKHDEGTTCRIGSIAVVGSSLIDLSLSHGVEHARSGRC
jgi:hypothetical protein